MDEEYTIEDATLRPTQNAWKCPNCGMELLTTECIISHKERCNTEIQKFNETVEAIKDLKPDFFEEPKIKVKICEDCGEEFEAREPQVDWTDNLCLKCRYTNKESIEFYNERY